MPIFGYDFKSVSSWYVCFLFTNSALFLLQTILLERASNDCEPLLIFYNRSVEYDDIFITLILIFLFLW